MIEGSGHVHQRLTQPVSMQDVDKLARDLHDAMQQDGSLVECVLAGLETALLDCTQLTSLHGVALNGPADADLDEGWSHPNALVNELPGEQLA